MLLDCFKILTVKKAKSIDIKIGASAKPIAAPKAPAPSKTRLIARTSLPLEERMCIKGNFFVFKEEIITDRNVLAMTVDAIIIIATINKLKSILKV